MIRGCKQEEFTGFFMSMCDSNPLLYFQFKYGKISSKHNGSVKKGVIFATYSSLIGESQSGGKYKTRFQQLLHWCGEDFDGVVSFQGNISSLDAEPQISPDEQLARCTQPLPSVYECLFMNLTEFCALFLFKNPMSLTGRFMVGLWPIYNDLQMCIVFIFHTLFPLVSEKTCFHLECLYWIEVIWTRSLLTFCFLRSVITFLNQMSLDCIWRVSQSQKCVSGRIIQTHKNWTCRVGTAEQTPQSSGRVCKCYRSVERITWDLLFEGIVDLNCSKIYLFLVRCLWTAKYGLYESFGHLGRQNSLQRIWQLYPSCWAQVNVSLSRWNTFFSSGELMPEGLTCGERNKS